MLSWHFLTWSSIDERCCQTKMPSTTTNHEDDDPHDDRSDDQAEQDAHHDQPDDHADTDLGDLAGIKRRNRAHGWRR